MAGQDESNSPRAEFPRFSKILRSRRDLVVLLRDQYKTTLAGRPLWLISGPGATMAYANVYKRVMTEVGFVDDVVIHSLARAPHEEEVEKLARETFATPDAIPGFVAYVGGQRIGDAAKVFLQRLRSCFEKQGKTPPQIIFGGIITALSNDGVFSDTASVFKNDLADSYKATAPNFILGHQLTLLRQPFDMKTSCVGDILSKASSLSDYEYSCETLGTYHNDFAADLARSAYEPWLGRGSTSHVNTLYLHTVDCLDEMFRSVQLCGLSMQLAGTSVTCSGSEHLGWKWLDDFIRRQREKEKDESLRVSEPKHGAGVLLMTIITLYMQGKSHQAERMLTIAKNMELPITAKELSIPATVIQVCLALGVGNRCPRWLGYLLDKNARPPNQQNERLTVLEQIEIEALADTIRRAMIDAKVATRDDFHGKLDRNCSEALTATIHLARDKVPLDLRDLYDDQVLQRLKKLV